MNALNRLLDRLSLRALVALGLFGLTFYVLHLLATKPTLASSQLFTTLATAIVVSGVIGGVVAFLFGSSQSSQAKDETIAAALKTPPTPPTPVQSVPPQPGEPQ